MSRFLAVPYPCTATAYDHCLTIPADQVFLHPLRFGPLILILQAVGLVQSRSIGVTVSLYPDTSCVKMVKGQTALGILVAGARSKRTR